MESAKLLTESATGNEFKCPVIRPNLIFKRHLYKFDSSRLVDWLVNKKEFHLLMKTNLLKKIVVDTKKRLAE